MWLLQYIITAWDGRQDEASNCIRHLLKRELTCHAGYHLCLFVCKAAAAP